MTKDDFIARGRRINFGALPYDLAHTVVICAFALAGWPISIYLPDSMVWAYVAFLFAGSIGYLWWSKRVDRSTGLLCHTCNRPMVRQAAKMAIDSNACPHCKKPAFAPEA
ncbi:hypothetical protein [Pseudoxanthomonas sacheonensis]|uniref:Zinc ribbon domain-containing protein n=1 Tax=Pseudoxanthomonas sacheonensis TaxID=443615 RepID=A0ABU1RRV9_9GAMM|nr:hypothetical protein [Pseudoxanthomonas sacheonensis]MDR6841506.1 hypothetical protein [Pseudoxanthomonas sacheonensis]